MILWLAMKHLYYPLITKLQRHIQFVGQFTEKQIVQQKDMTSMSEKLLLIPFSTEYIL